jgi:hypothetical protein
MQCIQPLIVQGSFIENLNWDIYGESPRSLKTQDKAVWFFGPYRPAPMENIRVKYNTLYCTILCTVVLYCTELNFTFVYSAVVLSNLVKLAVFNNLSSDFCVAI